jgi:hypothetical protein
MSMPRRSWLQYLCAVALLLPAAARAHSDLNGPHGGDVEDANPGPYHIETAAKGSTLSVFITDQDGNPSPAAGVTGNAVVLANKVKTPVTLAPVSGNQLQGTGSFTAAPDMRVLVTLTIDGQTQRALFTPPVQP